MMQVLTCYDQQIDFDVYEESSRAQLGFVICSCNVFSYYHNFYTSFIFFYKFFRAPDADPCDLINTH